VTGGCLSFLLPIPVDDRRYRLRVQTVIATGSISDRDAKAITTYTEDGMAVLYTFLSRRLPECAS
jgi:hypothetical protein